MTADNVKDTNDDVLVIKCPRCKKTHIYLLKVERSYVMYRALPTDQPTKRTFTRIFTCPFKDQEFQIAFSLVEPFGTIIHNAQVKGVKNADQKNA
jgi:hypothetical protein